MHAVARQFGLNAPLVIWRTRALFCSARALAMAIQGIFEACLLRWMEILTISAA